MFAGGGDLQTVGVVLRLHVAGDAAHAVVLSVRHPDGAMGGPAAPDGLEGQLQRIQQRVVAVEDRETAGLQILEDLALGLENAIPAAQILNVGVADVGDDGDVRLDHLPQIADLAEVVHARLDDRRLMLRRQLEQRQGRADVVVEILRRLQGAIPGGQHRRDHLLGGGLPHAAGDLDKGYIEPLPVRLRQGLQSQTGVLHLNVEFVRAQRLRKSGAQTARRAGVQRHVDEAVSVEILARQRDEQASLPDLPAVSGHLRHSGKPLLRILPHTAHRGLDLFYCKRLHIALHAPRRH